MHVCPWRGCARVVEEPICFSWPTFAGDRHSVTGAAQLLEHSCLAASSAAWEALIRLKTPCGAWQWWPVTYPGSSSLQQPGRNHHTPASPSCSSTLALFLNETPSGGEDQVWWVMCCNKDRLMWRWTCKLQSNDWGITAAEEKGRWVYRKVRKPTWKRGIGTRQTLKQGVHTVPGHPLNWGSLPASESCGEGHRREALTS